MIEKVDSEPPKTVSEFTQIQRWEDDGGAIYDSDYPHLPQVTETSTPRSMDVAGDDLLYAELKK